MVNLTSKRHRLQNGPRTRRHIVLYIYLSGITYLPEVNVYYLKGRLMLLVSNPRHLPCVEKVDPGLALLDLEQRAVVGEQPRLELLNHLDLQEKQTGQTFTD